MGYYHFPVLFATQHVVLRQERPGARAKARRSGARSSLCSHDRLAWAAATRDMEFWPCVATLIFVSRNG